MDNPCKETEKLIRCDLVNRYNEITSRYIEFENFRLWEYLVEHKHGAKISNPTICLWVNAEEFENNEPVYARSGDIEHVSRVVVDLFDEIYSITNTVIRYTRSAESEALKKILCSHIPDAVLKSNNCDVRIEKGYAITQFMHRQQRPVMMGLEAFE